MGQMWSSLPTEEKESYQQRAAQERERIAKELEAWKAAGGVLETDNGGDGSQKDPSALIFPLGRIRKICKLDPEVRGMSKEALLLITKCAELATSKLGQETVRVAQLQNRRKLLPEDIANVCSNREQFLFLKDDVKDLVKDQVVSKHDPKAPQKGDAVREAAAAGSKPLTSYFGTAKK
jgi:histone H3/H4